MAWSNQFAGDSARSPLDRTNQSPFSSGQPPSFKTNVNRAKTKRWVEAKAQSYDGDDWGDEYDEYGGAAEDEPPPAPPKTTGLRQQGQGLGASGANDAGRNFTSPLALQTSMAGGDGRRTTSAGAQQEEVLSPTSYTPPVRGQGNLMVSNPGGHLPTSSGAEQLKPQAPRSPPPADGRVGGLRQVSGVGSSDSAASETPSPPDFRQRRDFSPTAVPPPLHSLVAPTSAPATDETPTKFPPRRSSLSQTDRPTVQASPHSASTTQAPPAPAPAAPAKVPMLPRPSDIYKRVEVERQRERQNSTGQGSQPETIPFSPDKFSSGPGSGVVASPSASYTSSMGQKEGAPVAAAPSTSFNANSAIDSRPIVPASGQRSVSSQAAPAPTTAASSLGALPEVNFESAFGDDIWSSTAVGSDGLKQPKTPDPLSTQNSLRVRNDSNPDPALQHTTSVGFRSAVNQAFDRTDNGSVPPTPTSRDTTPVQSDLSVSRSNTDSTTGISPIMSRVPSATTAAAKLRSANNTTPAIAEEPAELETPTQAVPSSAAYQDHQRLPARPALDERSASKESLGAQNTYRHNFNTPPSQHSPARSPAVESVPDFTPTSGEMGMIGSAQQTGRIPLAPIDTGSKPNSNRNSIMEIQPLRPGSRDSGRDNRSQSPPKGRVRELAEKLGDTSNPRSGSAQSVHSTHSSENAATGQQLNMAKLQRPKIPGQWESYATQASFGHKEEPSTRAPAPLETTSSTQKEDSNVAPASPLDNLKAAGTALGSAIQSAIVGGTSPNETHGETGRSAPSGSYDPPQSATSNHLTINSNLSVDPSDDDEESDRLRKEIAKSLSPIKSSDNVSTSAMALSSEAHPDGGLGSRSAEGLIAAKDDEPPGPGYLEQRDSWEADDEKILSPSHVAAPESALSPPALSGSKVSSLHEPAPRSSTEGDKSVVERELPGAPQPDLLSTTMDKKVARPEPSRLSSEGLEVYDASNPPPMSPSPQSPALGSPASPHLPPPQYSDRTQSPQDDTLPARIPPFREILAIKSASERITTYQTTRKQFATMHVGLEDWLSAIMSAHPEHSSVASHIVTNPTIKPVGGTGGSTFNLASPSSTRLPNSSGGNNAGNAGASTADLTGNNSPGNKLSGQQVQAKGKDLLHTAGVLGGKGVTSAKGLFAKGKSRFKSGEKGEH